MIVQNLYRCDAMKKIKVGILMGGKSIEREVSFNTGRTLCDHSDTDRYSPIPIFQTFDGRLFILPWRFIYRGKISDFESKLEAEAQEIKWDDLKALVDFVYIALHGRYGEDGCVQGFLELLGIAYVGTKVLGSAFGMDKIKQKELLALSGVNVARGIVLTPSQLTYYQYASTALLKLLQDAQLEFPLVIKPEKEGSSLGVSVVFEQDQLFPALLKASCAAQNFQQAVLVEERLEGMEFTCIILFDENENPIFMPPTEVLYEAGHFIHGYEQKYMPGRSMKFTPARCDEKTTQAIQETCLHVAQLLDFKNIARIDGFVKKDGMIVIIDPNTLAGMAPSSFIFNQAAEIGMNHKQLISYLFDIQAQVMQRGL